MYRANLDIVVTYRRPGLVELTLPHKDNSIVRVNMVRNKAERQNYGLTRTKVRCGTLAWYARGKITKIGTRGYALERYTSDLRYANRVVSRSALTISNALREVSEKRGFELARPTEKFKRASSKTRLAELGGEQHKP
jgi:hypothetical protein